MKNAVAHRGCATAFLAYLLAVIRLSSQLLGIFTRLRNTSSSALLKACLKLTAVVTLNDVVDTLNRIKKIAD